MVSHSDLENSLVVWLDRGLRKRHGGVFLAFL